MSTNNLSSFMIILLLVTVLTVGFSDIRVNAVEGLPTVWVKIHRIQAVDAIEGFLEDGADWRYKVSVNDAGTIVTKEFKCTSNKDDIVVNHVDSFSDLEHKNVYVTIMLYEDDAFGYETADISSSDKYYDCTYHLDTGEFEGDETVLEGGYHKTSGDYDGSVTTDQNDANVWFTIWDNYDAPVADAGLDKDCYTEEKVNFDGSGSTASDGSSIVKYEWDFENDGVIDAEAEKTSYTYQEKGLYTCRLSITDSIGEQDEDICLVNVQNRLPTAEFTFSPTEPSVKDSVDFVDQSSDPDGYITSWFWDLGDGTTTTSQSPSHTFSQKGEQEVTLTVTDNDGASHSTTHTVTVINLPPIASFNYTPASPHTNIDVQFTDKSTDPENIPLSSRLWDFGDGYTSELESPTHKFTSKGDYNITLTVWDDENATDVFSMRISVTEPPPSEMTLPIPIWAIALLLIVIAGVGVYVLYIHRGHSHAAT